MEKHNLENEVSSHFCSNGHNLNDMKVRGLKYVSDVAKRKLEEQRLIAKLGCVLGKGMNVDFDFPGLLNGCD